MKALGRLVLVEWDDAWQDQDNFATAHGMAQTHHPITPETLGWVIVDDDEGISLVNERCLQQDPPTYRGRTFIPRAMVKKVTEVRLAAPKKERKRERHSAVVDVRAEALRGDRTEEIHTEESGRL